MKTKNFMIASKKPYLLIIMKIKTKLTGFEPRPAELMQTINMIMISY